MTVIDYGNVQLHISSCGVLEKMIITKLDAVVDVFIPHILPNGEKIIMLGPYFCKGDNGTYSTVTIDDKIKHIQNNAFAFACVKKVVWPQGCPYIPQGCFSSSTIMEISNIEHIVSIKDAAFEDTYYLTEFTWPSGCKSIPSCCFANSALCKISNIDNVELIGAAAFSNSEFKNFTIPKKVKVIGEYAFSESELEFIGLHDDITQIGYYAFEKTKIERIQWPEDCTEVPEGCFSNCVALTEIALPDTVTAISPYAFSGTSFDEFEWPNACKEIPDSCFKCSALCRITNINHVSSIGKAAFANINTLHEIDLSKSAIKYIAPDAFLNTDAKISYPYYFVS